MARLPHAPAASRSSPIPVRIRSGRWLAGLVFVLGSAWAFAQGAEKYPDRPVRIIVPFNPGGGVDITTRLIASRLSWPHPVVVENRGGGGSVIGTDVAARSPADGYTLLMTANPFTTNAALHSKLPFDSLAAFRPVIRTASAPLIVMVHPSIPVHSIRELIDYAKANPKKLSFGSSGNGGPQHLGGELFNSMAGVEIQHVPYKGSGPATADLLGGHVQVAFGDLLAALTHVKEGRLRALAVTSAKRSPFLPDIPTVAETLPGYETMTWFGLMAPAGTPDAIVARLNADIAAVLRLPDVVENLESKGNMIVAESPEAFGAFIEADIRKVRDLSKVANIRIE